MGKTKIIAIYLPQFHEFEENNKWWGKGFTEWTNVSSAEPLFPTHYQPKVPLNGYYDLLDNSTWEKQAVLAKQYGIDGFCIYHYWFNGKLLMEKPIENLLKEKKIYIPFFFSWANETWSRRWDGLNHEVLIKQEYGNRDDWQKHFDYLLPFFKDDRYIKVCNKPVLTIYRLNDISDYNQMIDYFNNRAIESGFEGIFFIETLNGFQKKPILDSSQASFYFEPSYTLFNDLGVVRRIYRYMFNHLKLSRFGFRDYLKYEKLSAIIRNRTIPQNRKLYLGAFPGWDNTPRKKQAGLVIQDNTPSKFYELLKYQYIQSVENNKEFLFINAWNEWAEGAFLEPDDKYQFGCLEAIRKVKDETN